MVAKEVFVNYLNFNLVWLQHASIHVKKHYSKKKGNCQGILQERNVAKPYQLYYWWRISTDVCSLYNRMLK